MLISLSKNFIFIANTKTGSTTVERKLRNCSEVAITGTKIGKHMPYSQVEKKLDFMFEASGIPIDSYFRFGVIREPVDWVVSWYNYRHRDSVGAANSCKGIEFAEFAEEVMKSGKQRAFARIGMQEKRFVDSVGNLGVDFLIPLNRLNDDLADLSKALCLKSKAGTELNSKNVSPKIISAKDITPSLAEKLRVHFAADVALYTKASEGGFGAIAEAVQQKLAGKYQTTKKAV